MKKTKFTSILAGLCACSAIMATMGVSVSAADWSQASYADNDPNTVKIISADANGVTFTTTDLQTDICKARITLDKILKNPDDYSKIAKMTWNVTYEGVTPDFVTEGGALSGGTYATNKNSEGYNIKAEEAEDGSFIWEDKVYTTTDSVTFDEGETPEKDGEMVFMDWSFANIGSQNIKVTVSDLKIFDKDGNEIEQLGYGEYVVADTAPSLEEDTTVPEDGIVKEDSAKTGNVETVVLAASALVASACVLAKKNKEDEEI